MPYSLDQNGVTKSRNQTLLDMVRSMLCSSNLPNSLWIDALKTTMDIFNKVPTKVIPKMSFVERLEIEFATYTHLRLSV